MRVYDTPTHWHEEPDVDPVLEQKMFDLYGENWQEKIARDKEEYEFYNFEDDVI